MQINQQQKGPVEAIEHIHVVAIPGSGKTRTVIAKTKYMLSNGCKDIVIVTYTNASAKEVMERLTAECGSETLKDVTVATFHSLMLRHIALYAPQYKLVSPEDRTSLLHDIYLRHNDTQEGYEKFEEYSFQINKEKNSEYEEMLAEYYAQLSENKINTLDNVIGTALDKMMSGELPLLPCRYLMVDEWQDADEQQLKLVLLHGKSGRIITTVGDCDQSIYGFRNALGYKAFKLQEQHLKSKEYQLTVNYRSKKEILDAAFNLIAKNELRIDKRIESHRGYGGLIEHHLFSTRYEEAEWVAQKIQFEPDIPTLILARTRVNLQQVEAQLSSLSIPYRMRSNNRYYDVTCCKLFISALYSISKNEESGLMRLLNILFGQFSQDLNPSTLFKNSNIASTLSPQQHSAFLGIKNALQYQRVGDTNKAVHTLAGAVVPELKQHGYSATERIYHLSESIKKLSGTLSQRLAILYKAQDQDEAKVELMTMHSSKGLERYRVFVIGFANGVIPSVRKTPMKSSHEVIQEERRLAFVALTRAQEELYITSYKGTHKQPERNGKSMFFSELGEITHYDH